MKLIDLMKLANEGYPDGFLDRYYNKQTGEFLDDGSDSDGLARFIVLELIGTFDHKASSKKQLIEAHRVLSRAMIDLEGVISSLKEGTRKR